MEERSTTIKTIRDNVAKLMMGMLGSRFVFILQLMNKLVLLYYFLLCFCLDIGFTCCF